MAKSNHHQKKQNEYAYEILRKMELPPDLIEGHMILTAVGRHEIRVENYRGILSCDCEQIVLLTRDCRLVIQGKRLFIKYYTAEEMMIIGIFLSIFFEVS